MLYGIPLQMAYVTTDVERACALFREQYGVTQFLRADVADVSLDWGRTISMRIAHAWLGPTWLEIIEPVDGEVGVYRDWLPAEGFALRFHHVGIRHTDIGEWDRLTAEVARRGYKVVLAITASPDIKVLYIDTVAELGHYVEYLFVADPSRSVTARMPQNFPAAPIA